MKQVIVAVALVLALTACGGSSAKGDPYAAYLARNPDPSIVLTREEAQGRALLGCRMKWAPGTIDALLQDLYC
jgi:hypothetical protein